MSYRLIILSLTLRCAALLVAQNVPLDDVSRLDLKGMRAEQVTYGGFKALKATVAGGPTGGDALAVVKGVRFHNGTIDVDVSGAPAQGADTQVRGFIGIAFRVSDGVKSFEEFYIRPTNGRAGDQLRRNHSVQYVSFPDWPWNRLRKESPGVYESYADMAPGEWIHLRIVVNGTNGSLYVNSAAQPCLIVHDLKLGDSEGAVALWIGPGTEGYFRDLRLTQ